MRKTISINARIDITLKNKIDEYHKKTRISKEGIVEKALNEFFNKIEKA